jgi:hypothetical protein
MTPQEVFDQVVAHLRKQGRQAKNRADSKCKYRTTVNIDGQDVVLSCAAGCLMQDNEYNLRMDLPDNSTFKNVITQDWVSQSLKDRLGPHVELITKLQVVHDSMYAPQNWESQLQRVAHEENLKYTPPESK